jgi:hypothetical protein
MATHGVFLFYQYDEMDYHSNFELLCRLFCEIHLVSKEGHRSTAGGVRGGIS